MFCDAINASVATLVFKASVTYDCDNHLLLVVSAIKLSSLLMKGVPVTRANVSLS